MTDTMIFLKATKDDAVNPKQIWWTEKDDVESIDKLLADISKSLDTDEHTMVKRREYEVLEVQVVRRVKVYRNVTHKVEVVTEEAA